MSSQRSLVEERFDAEVRAADAASADWWADLERCSCDLAGASVGHAYNEEAFRYFLDIERKRSEVSGRPFLLLLIDLKRDARSELESPIEPANEGPLFAALTRCLRETDFVGWYRANRSIGAVLTQDTSAALAGTTEFVAGRITQALQAELPASVSARLQLRIYQLPSNTGRQS
jgi:hypothetical protein